MKRAILVAAWAVLAGGVLGVVVPTLTHKAAALSPSYVDLYEKPNVNTPIDLAKITDLKKGPNFGTCQAALVPAITTGTQSKRRTLITNTMANSLASPADPSGATATNLQYISDSQLAVLTSTVNTYQNVIQFSSPATAIDPTQVIGGKYNNDTAACDNYTLYWVGATNGQAVYASPMLKSLSGTIWDYYALVFTEDTFQCGPTSIGPCPTSGFITGTLTYYTVNLLAVTPIQQGTTKFIIGDGGTPAPPVPPGSTVGINTVNMQWADAASLQVTSTNVTGASGKATDTKLYAGEFYNKALWGPDTVDDTGGRYFPVGCERGTKCNTDGNTLKSGAGALNKGQEAFYFFSDPGTSNDSDDRKGFRSGAGKPECANPIPGGSAIPHLAGGDPFAAQICASGDPTIDHNCVPFVEMNVPINFSSEAHTDSADVKRLRTNLDDIKVGRASFTFYDYDDSCQAHVYNVSVDGTSLYKSQIWFFYDDDPSVNAFATVFSNGTGAGSTPTHEAALVGTYTVQTGGAYQGGQANCAVVHVSPDDLKNEKTNPIFPVTWDMKTTNCGTGGTGDGAVQLQVNAIGGDVGRQGFEQVGSQTPPVNQSPTLSCDLLGGLLNWLFCPVVYSAQAAASGFDNAVNNWLNDGGITQVFQGGTGSGYYKVWKLFRSAGLIIIALSLMIAILAEAAGWQIVSPLTLRKKLPVALFVIVLMTVLWPLLRDGANLSLGVGNSLRGAVYTAFSPTSGSGVQNIGGGAAFVGALLSTGAALSFGWIGLVLFAVTLFLGGLFANGLLAILTTVGTVDIITAPLWVPCAILDFTKPVYKKGKDFYVGFFLLFGPLYNLLVAIFNAVSETSFYGNGTSNPGLFSQLIGIFLKLGGFLAGLIAIDFVLKLMGGAGKILRGGVTGVLGGLKKARQEARRRRYRRWGEGTLFNPESRATRFMGVGTFLNALGGYAGGVSKPGGFTRMFGRGGAAARASTRIIDPDKYDAEDQAFAGLKNDADANAVIAMGFDEAALRALPMFQGAGGAARLRSAVDRARPVRVTGRSRYAAAVRFARTGDIDDQAALETVAQSVGQGNAALTASTRETLQRESANAGRRDLRAGQTAAERTFWGAAGPAGAPAGSPPGTAGPDVGWGTVRGLRAEDVGKMRGAALARLLPAIGRWVGTPGAVDDRGNVLTNDQRQGLVDALYGAWASGTIDPSVASAVEATLTGLGGPWYATAEDNYNRRNQI